jgi:hypothetical protein
MIASSVFGAADALFRIGEPDMESHGVPVPAAAEERRMAVGRFIRLTTECVPATSKPPSASGQMLRDRARAQPSVIVVPVSAISTMACALPKAPSRILVVSWPKAIAGRRASQEFFISWTLVVCQATTTPSFSRPDERHGSGSALSSQSHVTNPQFTVSSSSPESVEEAEEW